MGADRDFIGRMAPELELLLPGLDERSRRLVLGAVARAAGDGGVTAVAQAAGASWRTVADGAGELASGDDAGPGRVRRAGGGRKKPEERDPRLIPALRELLEASTRGDRQSLITWRECQILCARGLFAARYRMFIRCLSFALSEVYMPGLCSAFPEPGIPFPAWAGTARPDFPGHSGRLLPDPPRIAWRLFPLPFNIADRSHCVTRPAAFPSVYFSRCGRGRGVRGAGCRCGPRWPRPGPRRRRPG